MNGRCCNLDIHRSSCFSAFIWCRDVFGTWEICKHWTVYEVLSWKCCLLLGLSRRRELLLIAPLRPFSLGFKWLLPAIAHPAGGLQCLLPSPRQVPPEIQRVELHHVQLSLPLGTESTWKGVFLSFKASISLFLRFFSALQSWTVGLLLVWTYPDSCVIMGLYASAFFNWRSPRLETCQAWKPHLKSSRCCSWGRIVKLRPPGLQMQ